MSKSVIMGRHWLSNIEAGPTLTTAVISKVKATVAYQSAQQTLLCSLV